jgi:hypothetical protein
MTEAVNSTVSLWQAQLVGGSGPAIGSLHCCFPPSHLASASAGFPSSAQSYSVVAVRHRLFLVNSVDCYIGISRNSRSHLVQVQVSLLASHLLL